MAGGRRHMRFGARVSSPSTITMSVTVMHCCRPPPPAPRRSASRIRLRSGAVSLDQVAVVPTPPARTACSVAVGRLALLAAIEQVGDRLAEQLPDREHRIDHTCRAAEPAAEHSRRTCRRCPVRGCRLRWLCSSSHCSPVRDCSHRRPRRQGRARRRGTRSNEQTSNASAQHRQAPRIEGKILVARLLRGQLQSASLSARLNARFIDAAAPSAPYSGRSRRPVARPVEYP